MSGDSAASQTVFAAVYGRPAGASGAWQRTSSLLDALRRIKGLTVVTTLDQSTTPQRIGWQIRALGNVSKRPLDPIQVNRSRFRCGRLNIPDRPDLAITDMAAALPMALAARPKHLILNLCDVPSEYSRVVAQSQLGIFRSTLALANHQAWERWEVKNLPIADVVIVPSEEDAVEIVRLAPRANVLVIPSAVATPNSRPSPASWRQRLAFVGSDHPRNIAAVVAVIADLAPGLRAASPEFELAIAGPLSDASIQQIDRAAARSGVADNVRLLGFVNDLQQVYTEGTLAISYYPVGAGTKLKAAEAASYGVPVVGNRNGLRGLADMLGEGAVVEDTIAGLNRSIIGLWGDRAEWQRRASVARHQAQTRLATSVIREQWTDIICSTLEEGRRLQ